MLRKKFYHLLYWDGLSKKGRQIVCFSADTGNLTAYYQLACLYCLTGRYEEGLRFLKKADSFDALPYLEEILEDDWLEALGNTPEGREFLLVLEKKASLQQ